jgi:ABC-type sugar transport system ATPase subunit
MMMEEVLRAEDISKRFPGVLAVDHVSLSLRQGEILALVGENGAGKSTLTQVIGGAQRPDEGQILLEGRPVAFNSPEDAIRLGISMVFQELSLVGSLSIAENIFSNRQPVGALNIIRWGELYQQTAEFLGRFELDLNPRLLVKQLSMGQQQILEILKAISTSPKVLILDEPTSSLTEGEINYLFENIRRLQAQGMSFIYITHKLSEVFQIASRVMVMRDGRHIDSKPVSEVTENDLVAMMVGRQITNLYGARSGGDHDEYFRVEAFSRRRAFRDITFSLKRGEILGFAGLVGAGRTEVGRAIFGIDRKDSGRLVMNGVELHISKPHDAIRHKIAYLTEDRKGQGLFLSMSLRENLAAPSMDKFTNTMGFVRRSLLDRHAGEMVREFAIATPSVDKKVLNLSGGNQQKALVAMWMGIQPEVIIFDEPTRGVDVGARAEIYARLRDFAASGVGVIMISSDLPELIGMCDRILVMHQGRITGEVMREDFSEALILSYAAGLGQEVRPAQVTSSDM